MKKWTYKEIADKVRGDLGIEQETFVKPDELRGYVNEAIDMIEAEIHTLYEDYFLTRTSFDIVSGQAEYTLPANIYANKIRGLVYRENTDVYPIKRYKKDISMFEKVEIEKIIADDYYRYIIFNDDTDGPLIELVPTPIRSVTSGMRMFYIRNANRMEDDNSVCDIPEFTSVVVQYAKMMCYEKESDPRYDLAASKFNQMYQLMINTLTNMTPDGDNEIEKDLDIYVEMGVEEDF